MSAHVYWRINFATPTNGNNPAICELAMHTSVGGSDVCSGGTAGGTSINASFPAANAFDGNLSGTFSQDLATKHCRIRLGPISVEIDDLNER